MFFLKRFFKRSVQTVECPRCLGKGHVNDEDIVRLRRQFRWMPGKCAYCEGTGQVDPSMISKVPADEVYLTTALSARER